MRCNHGAVKNEIKMLNWELETWVLTLRLAGTVLWPWPPHSITGSQISALNNPRVERGNFWDRKLWEKHPKVVPWELKGKLICDLSGSHASGVEEATERHWRAEGWGIRWTDGPGVFRITYQWYRGIWITITSWVVRQCADTSCLISSLKTPYLLERVSDFAKVLHSAGSWVSIQSQDRVILKY